MSPRRPRLRPLSSSSSSSSLRLRPSFFLPASFASLQRSERRPPFLNVPQPELPDLSLPLSAICSQFFWQRPRLKLPLLAAFSVLQSSLHCASLRPRVISCCMNFASFCEKRVGWATWVSKEWPRRRFQTGGRCSNSRRSRPTGSSTPGPAREREASTRPGRREAHSRRRRWRMRASWFG